MTEAGCRRAFTTSLAPTTRAPGIARDEVEHHLPADLAPVRNEVALLTTELVTNAVIHAHSVVDLDLYLYDDGLCVTVTDYGPGTPAIRAPDESGGGYGLRLVDKLATRWGHETIDPLGKRVWFELRSRLAARVLAPERA